MVKRQIAKTKRLGFDSPLRVRFFFFLVPHLWELELELDIFFFIDDPAFI